MNDLENYKEKKCKKDLNEDSNIYDKSTSILCLKILI